MQIGCFSVLTKESWGRANKSFPRHVSEVNETREREREKCRSQEDDEETGEKPNPRGIKSTRASMD